MLRKILDRIRNANTHEDIGGFQIVPDADGLNFILPQQEFNDCKDGQGNEWVLNQFIALQMLAEEGTAEPIANGFFIESDDVVRLDDDTRYLLEVPNPWPGEFELNVKGQTTQRSFSLNLVLNALDGEQIATYKLHGPLLKLSEDEVFLPTYDQWIVLNAVSEHQNLSDSEKTEYNNLLAVYKVQKGAAAGAPINLSHFSELSTTLPEKIGVSIKEDEEGGISLSPSFGGEFDPESVEKRLGQIGVDGQAQNIPQSLRVDEKIVILNKEKLNATQEIIRNRKIPASQVKQFFATPSAFLDTSLIDLDVGFSLRVRGATVFRHGYFGDTDSDETDWFETISSMGARNALPVERIDEIVKSIDELREFQTVMEDAVISGAESMIFKNTEIPIGNLPQLKERLKELENQLLNPEIKEAESREDEGLNPEPVIVDIEQNDEDLAYGEEIQEELKKRLYNGPIEWSDYRRQPYKHQEEGVRWLIGLAQEKLDGQDSLLGSLLADDMGLGKTYMSLVGIAESYKLADKPRPTLVVAPLSVINSWRDEVDKTYNHSPFSDIVILQADAELSKYRISGAGVEIRQRENADLLDAEESAEEAAIKYSLKVGDLYGPDRLDQPKRLVLTTYQTLRDYQFSLCKIDWGFVVFDEAQNIKNPNALQTRAAKGLRAQFKLLMTGTPVENHLGDFWCLFDCARAGLFGAYQGFRRNYMAPISQAKGGDERAVRIHVGRELRKKAGGLMLRRLKEDHLDGLPNKTLLVGTEQSDDRFVFDQNLVSTMGSVQRLKYEGVINTTIESKSQADGRGALLRGLAQLRDVCLHPSLIDGGVLPLPESVEHAMELINQSAKLANVVDILKQIQHKDEKVLIFLINKRLQRFLKIALQRIFSTPVEIINGDTKAVAKKKNTPTRTTYIREFEERPGFGILIMSPVAAGVGLTITAANHVIHLERHWNPAKESQATDRVYRIGQDRDVQVYVPILHHPELDSFDVNLDRLLGRKLDLKDAVVTPEEVSPDELLDTGIFGSSFSKSDKVIVEADLGQLPWSHFESLVAEIVLREYGGRVLLTPQSNDKGADVVVMGDSVNVLIQCKHTKQDQLKSELPLREIHSARPFYERSTQVQFDKLFLISNVKSYGRQIQEAASMLGVELIDEKYIIQRVRQYGITQQDVLRRHGQPRFVL